jgi:hypothetical protein
MKLKFTFVSIIVFLFFAGVPSLPGSASHSVGYTTTTMFSYSVTLFPANSSWSATITNIGGSIVWNTVSISNATIQDNEFLLSKKGSAFFSPGQTATGAFHCQFFNGTSGTFGPCTISSGATYRFCASVGNNTGTIAFDQLLGCFDVKANGLAIKGSTHHRLDINWNTSILGGNIAKWYFRMNNVGTRTVDFYVTLSWQCYSITQGWHTCTQTSPKVELAGGHAYSFRTLFRPLWNSIPSGKTGLTVTVWANLGTRFQLDENAYNLTAS